MGAEFGDITDHVFGGLAARERPFGVGPIALGLTLRARRSRLIAVTRGCRANVILLPSIGAGVYWFSAEFEIPEVVGAACSRVNLDEEVVPGEL